MPIEAPYLEAMAKAFLLDHPKLFMGAPRLFNTKLWFHGTTILALFRALSELQSLKTKKTAPVPSPTRPPSIRP